MLYRKYRPKTLNEIFKQEDIVEDLKKSLKNKKLEKGYIINGTTGTGKISIARIIASIFFCENSDENGNCGKCLFCKNIREGNFNENVIEVDLSIPSSLKFLEIKVSRKISGKKVFILKNAQFMTIEIKEFFEKFNNTENCNILPIFISTKLINGFDEFKRYKLKTYSYLEMEELLSIVAKRENINIQRSALYEIATNVGGSMKKALFYLERVKKTFPFSCNREQVKVLLSKVSEEIIRKFYQKLIEGDSDRIFELVENFELNGINAEELFNGLQDFIFKLGITSSFRKRMLKVAEEVKIIIKKMSLISNSFYIQYFVANFFNTPDIFEEEIAEKEIPFLPETIKSEVIEKNLTLEEEILKKYGNYEKKYVDITLEELKKFWPEIVQSFSLKDPTNGMVLYETVPNLILNGVIYVAFKNDVDFFFKRSKSKKIYKKILEDLINNKFNSNIKVEFELLTEKEETEIDFK